MLALSTDSLKGYGLNRIFGIVKAAGYDSVDLAIDPKNFDTQNAEYVKSLIDETGIPVSAIQTANSSSPKKILAAINMAKLIGTRIVVVQPPKIFDFKFIQWLKNEIPKIRQKENISIALENAPSQMFLGIIPEHAMGNILDLKKFKHACIDTSRIAQKKEDLIRVYKTLQKFLVHIHLSNVKAGKAYYPPDKGILPIESLLTKLKQDGFPGTISMKVNGKFIDAGDDDKVMKNLADMKLFYETYFENVKVMPMSGSSDKE
jgi:sugar phosphate isomerase/epimerase